jgi:hypothetical protein
MRFEFDWDGGSIVSFISPIQGAIAQEVDLLSVPELIANDSSDGVL